MKDTVSDKQATKFAAMGDEQAGLIVAQIAQSSTATIESGVKLIAAE